MDMDMCLLKMHQQAKVRKGAGISHWYLVRGDALSPVSSPMEDTDPSRISVREEGKGQKAAESMQEIKARLSTTVRTRSGAAGCSLRAGCRLFGAFWVWFRGCSGGAAGSG